MSVQKLTLGLMVTVAIFCATQTASAQTGEYLPFADPMEFDPDFRWFEPVTAMDLADMRPRQRASTGWFAGFDKMNLYISRPENVPSYYQLDDGWGDRVDIGYMTEDHHGWLASFMNINGPNATRTTRRERINRVNPDDVLGADTDDDASLDLRGQLLPKSDRNAPGLSERVYFPGTSLNILEMNSIELNKTFRLEPYHYGGVLEPMIGLRYMHIEDVFFSSNYASTEDFPTPTLINPDEDPTEQLVKDLANAENQMFGGQIGFRYFRHFDRFMFSTDLRVFAMQNFQSNVERTIVETTIYDDVGTDAETILFERESLNTRDARNDEFAFGYDIRSEVAYMVTRDFSIRGGMQLFDIAQGVWRGRISDQNDQRVIGVGYTFGLTLNR